MFCPHCGEQIAEQAEICPKCGVRVKGSNNSDDKPNIAVNLLSFCCIPILGIIMFFVWKGTKPKAAKSALIWSIIPMIIWFVLSLVTGVLSALLDGSYFY